ncbi:hypothetical protein KDA00_03665 [Candidatus Saccharibacteria bacterium]|nr:hypothetical protein [Candidatus Saccharibacteria bacterium]
MILTGEEIKKEVANGNIVIYPFNPELVNPNSYNYHLGNVIIEIVDEIIDPKKPSAYRIIQLNDKGFVMKPNKLYLGSTVECIGSDYYVTSLIGRSSIGRLGLFLQITADLGNIGAKHHWTLELKVVQPLKIYPGMRIGQVSFWKPAGKKSMRYMGKYRDHTEPHYSMLYEELSKQEYAR